MGKLHVVRAGAGSGKTYSLCQAIAEQVALGLDPARLVATTFTRKAAAELKGRIQLRLLTDKTLSPADRVEKTARLEVAAIGTVHSVAQRLLQRYALQLGLSPQVDVLDEAAADKALDRLLAELPGEPWKELADAFNRCAQPDRPQNLVLSLLKAKRGNCIADELFLEQLAQGVDDLCTLLAPDGTEHVVGFDDLYRRAAAVLPEILACTDATEVTRKAVATLRGVIAQRSGQWQDYRKLAHIKAGKTSGADATLEPLRTAAAGVPRSPELHRDVRQLVELAGKQAVALERAYGEFKQARGLADFVDLEVELLRLLNAPELAESLQADFTYVVVDEFQDTNPLQLAIFQRLQTLAQQSRWVGDAKQAIYGFRGTAPELVRGVWEAVPKEQRSTLGSNWRSNTGLVDVVRDTFVPVLGAEVEQEAQRQGEPARAVERWLLTDKKKEERHQAIAAGVAHLRAEGTPLRDISILTRTNLQADEIACACRNIGIPALRELAGLFSFREGQLVLAGLRVAADHSDSLAAATVVHLLSDPREATPKWLAERLAAVADDERQNEAMAQAKEVPPTKPAFDDHPTVRRLREIDTNVLSPSAFVREVVLALDVLGLVPRWGKTAERNANVDTMFALATSYEDETLRQAGAPGAAPTAAGLVLHLERLRQENKDKTNPPFGIDAVRVDTYHKAKGLEWPVVILTQLDYSNDADLWGTVVTGGTPGSSTPLEGRTLSFWPWPFGRHPKNPRLVIDAFGLDAAARTTTRGQLLDSQAHDEALRLLYVGFTRARDKLVLAHDNGNNSWLASLGTVDHVLPPDAEPGEHELEGLRTTYVVRHLDAKQAEQLAAPSPDFERWIAAPAETEGPPAVPRYINPSQAAPVELADVDLVHIGPKLLKNPKDDPADVGDAVHAYLAAIPSLDALDTQGREKVAQRCLDGFLDAGARLTSTALVEAGQHFSAWLKSTYPRATMSTEVSVSARRADGSQIVGIIDCLVALPDGSFAIVDHKTAVIAGEVEKKAVAAKLAAHAGQLALYREALEAVGTRVEGTWIHLVMLGLMVRV